MWEHAVEELCEMSPTSFSQPLDCITYKYVLYFTVDRFCSVYPLLSAVMDVFFPSVSIRRQHAGITDADLSDS